MKAQNPEKSQKITSFIVAEALLGPDLVFSCGRAALSVVKLLLSLIVQIGHDQALPPRERERERERESREGARE